MPLLIKQQHNLILNLLVIFPSVFLKKLERINFTVILFTIVIFLLAKPTLDVLTVFKLSELRQVLNSFVFIFSEPNIFGSQID